MIGYLLFSGYAIHQNTERDSLIAAIWWHVGVGVMATLPMMIYGVFWLFGYSFRLAAHRVFLPWLFKSTILLFALLTLTGVMTVWTRGSSLKVFDWLSVSSPFDKMPQAYELMETVHGLFGFASLVCLGLLLTVLVFNCVTGNKI